MSAFESILSKRRAAYEELAMTNEQIVDLFLAIASSTLSRDQVEQRLREKVKSKN